MIDAIKQRPGATDIELRGYTDAIGHPESNLRLPEATALAVRSVLIQAGVEPSGINATEGTCVAQSAEGYVASLVAGCSINILRLDILVR